MKLKWFRRQIEGVKLHAPPVLPANSSKKAQFANYIIQFF